MAIGELDCAAQESAAASKSGEELEGVRAAATYRRMRPEFLVALSRRATFRDSSKLAALVLTVAVVFFEIPLWEHRPPEVPGPRALAGWVTFSALLLLARSWLLDRFWAGQSRGRVRRPIRIVRFLLASLPLGGPLTLPLWRHLEETRPTSLFRQQASAARLDLASGRELEPSRPRPQISSLIYPTLVLQVQADCLVPLLLALWLGEQSLSSPTWRTGILVTCCVCHLAGLALAWVVAAQAESRERGFRGVLQRCLPLAWLLPSPGHVLALLWVVYSKPEGAIVTRAHVRREVERVPRWLALDGALARRWQAQPWWRAWRRPAALRSGAVQPGDVQGRVAVLIYLKGFLLGFETFGLVGALAAVVRYAAVLQPAFSAALNLATAGAALFSCLGLLVELPLDLAMRALRLRRLVETFDRNPYGLALFVSPAALFVGLTAIYFKPLPAYVLFTALFIAAMVGSPGRSRSMALSCLWLAWVMGLALLLLHGGLLWALVTWLALAGLAVPATIVVGLLLGPWLLRPFGWRDVLRHDLPVGMRIVLGLLGATAILPFGGLAMPFWIFARHRLWPEYTRRWLEAGASTGHGGGILG